MTTKPVTAQILIADDQDDLREALSIVLSREGFATRGAASPAEAWLLLETGDFAALLLDLNFRADTTSGQEGLAFMAKVKAVFPGLPVIVLTGWGSVELAVQALRAGAADFLEKPWENTRLITVLRSQLALAQARQTNASLTHLFPSTMAGRSSPMRQVRALAEKIASAHVPVLITGESGTGKGVMARHIAALSTRRDQPFVTLDMGSLPESLVEAELFGHARGAFTDAKTERIGHFEIANNGVIFLDEIGNASLATQVRLLSVLEDGKIVRVGESRPRQVDVRIIAATNADLGSLIAAGRFRQDLLFRLNTVEIRMPPLRDRGEDIIQLALHFLEIFAARHGRSEAEFDPEALSALTGYPWPGNVRELAHVVERAVLLSETARIKPADLRLSATSAIQFERMTLDQAERYLIQLAIAEANGDTDVAARRLGLSRSAFYRRLAAVRR
jgi:DNA-binding NtrC family response regulator